MSSPAKSAPDFPGSAVGRRLLSLRHQLKMTQEELAAAVGVTDGTIHLYERGRTALPTDVGLRVCRRLCFDERWLATGEGDARPGVDLMSHAAYLGVDARLPLHTGFEALRLAYASLDAELSMKRRVVRLLNLGAGDLLRLRHLLDWMIIRCTEDASPGEMAQFYELVARSIVASDAGKALLEGPWEKSRTRAALADSMPERAPRVSRPRRR